MLICDTHADTLHRMPYTKNTDITLKRLLHPGHTWVQALALFVGGNGLKGDDRFLIDRELENFELLKKKGFHQIRRIEEAQPDKANVLLTIEGGEAFGDDLSSVQRFAELGVRIAALVWNNENLLAHPAVKGSDNGLTPFGWQVAKELRKQHIALDISHLNERGSWELMESSVPPMASHSCARALCDHPRNLTDEQLRALFHAGGYVGVNFYPVFLKESGQATVDDLIDHIAYMCDLGGERCVGLGSDFDGIDSYPEGLRTPDQIPALFERMQQRGFDEALIKNVAGENFARYLSQIDHYE